MALPASPSEEISMPEDTRSQKAKSEGSGDDEDAAKIDAVLRGEVDPTAPDKTADDVAANPRSEDDK
jgi:hypothetical protein